MWRGYSTKGFEICRLENAIGGEKLVLVVLRVRNSVMIDGENGSVFALFENYCKEAFELLSSGVYLRV